MFDNPYLNRTKQVTFYNKRLYGGENDGKL